MPDVLSAETGEWLATVSEQHGMKLWKRHEKSIKKSPEWARASSL
jgi:hypothetical protein